MILQSLRLTLRPIRIEDAAALYKAHGDGDGACRDYLVYGRLRG